MFGFEWRSALVKQSRGLRSDHMSSAAHWLVLARKGILSTQESGHFNSRTHCVYVRHVHNHLHRQRKERNTTVHLFRRKSPTVIKNRGCASVTPLSSSCNALPILLPKSSLGGKRSSSHCGLSKDRDGKVIFQLPFTSYSISLHTQIKLNILLMDTAWNTSSVGRQAWPLWMEIKAQHSVRRLDTAHESQHMCCLS